MSLANTKEVTHRFFKRKVKYVGHVVSEQGIEADPEKVDKIKHWPTPTNPEHTTYVAQMLKTGKFYSIEIQNSTLLSII